MSTAPEELAPVHINKDGGAIFIHILIAAGGLLLCGMSIAKFASDPGWNTFGAFMIGLLLAFFALTIFGRHAFMLTFHGDPLMTLGTDAIHVHFSGDIIPYSRIEAVHFLSVRWIRMIAISLTPGTKPKFQLALLRLKGAARFSLLASFDLPARKIALEIERRVTISRRPVA